MVEAEAAAAAARKTARRIRSAPDLRQDAPLGSISPSGDLDLRSPLLLLLLL
jgi:hypothetical protein